MTIGLAGSLPARRIPTTQTAAATATAAASAAAVSAMDAATSAASAVEVMTRPPPSRAKSLRQQKYAAVGDAKPPSN